VADSNVSAALTVINVDPMKRYRYRLINSACFAAYNFSIDGHDLTVIEIDGTETVPHTVGVIPIFAGMLSGMLIPNKYVNAR
jgi:iron transport multicopper oxidase